MSHAGMRGQKAGHTQAQSVSPKIPVLTPRSTGEERAGEAPFVLVLLVSASLPAPGEQVPTYLLGTTGSQEVTISFECFQQPFPTLLFFSFHCPSKHSGYKIKLETPDVLDAL